MQSKIEALEEERRKILGQDLPLCLELIDKELLEARNQQLIAGGDGEGEGLSEQQTPTECRTLMLIQLKRPRSRDDEDEQHPTNPRIDIDLNKTLENDNEEMQTQSAQCLPVNRQLRLRTHLNKEKKQRLKWTPELEEKFEKVVKDLGGAREATAQKIMDRMQTEGLHRKQYGRHLQNYRMKVEKAARNSG